MGTCPDCLSAIRTKPVMKHVNNSGKEHKRIDPSKIRTHGKK
jgi:hypothetical protein